MVKTEREYREDIVAIGRQVSQKGWVAASDGSITIRLDGERILATPAGASMGMMPPDDLIVADRQGEKLSGRREPTPEIALHLAVYQLRPDVRAVVHAHPPVAAGYAAAGKPLNLPPEAAAGLGPVPASGSGPPGTAALVEPLLPLIPNHDSLLVADHGAVCYGGDVYQAYFRMETMEHVARIQLVAELLGRPPVPPRAEGDKLLDSRARSGAKTRHETGGEERFTVTRSELIAMVDEALRARGVA
jgi:L-fuculose-phosphate aldolase